MQNTNSQSESRYEVRTTQCPEHPDVELRRENYNTGFCIKCSKHYPMCCVTEYMNICIYLKDHEGLHMDKHGHEWVSKNQSEAINKT